MMSLSRAKTQAFFATAILISSVVLCWSAEAAPKNRRQKQVVRNASLEITTQIGKNTDTVTCYVYNKSNDDICVVYDVYPSGISPRQHVERYRIIFREKPGAALPGRSPLNRHQCSASSFQQHTSLGSRVSSASYTILFAIALGTLAEINLSIRKAMEAAG